MDPIEDGAELFFEELIGISDEEISRWIPPKEQFQTFLEPSLNRRFDPDYRSREILDRVADAIRGSADA